MAEKVESNSKALQISRQVNVEYSNFSDNASLLSSISSDNPTLSNVQARNKNMFAFLQRLHEESLEGNIVQDIYRLYEDKEINLQLIYIFCSNYILKAVKNPHFSLLRTCEDIKDILNMEIKIVTEDYFELGEEVHETDHYKIKFKQRDGNAFNCKEITNSFNDYHQLFTAINQVNSKVKDLGPLISSLVHSVRSKEELQVIDDRIIYKIQPKNEWICINEVMQEILPQATEEEKNFIKEIQEQFCQSNSKNIPELVNSMVDKWQLLVNNILLYRSNNNIQTRCFTDDWITVELIFPTQTKAINCLKAIQKWCKENRFTIVGIVDKLAYQEKQFQIKIMKNQVTCRIRLMINYQIKLKRFREAITCIIGEQRNPIFNTFLNINKNYQFSLLNYLEGVNMIFQNSQAKSLQIFQKYKINVRQYKVISNTQKMIEEEKINNKRVDDEQEGNQSREIQKVQKEQYEKIEKMLLVAKKDEQIERKMRQQIQQKWTKVKQQYINELDKKQGENNSLKLKVQLVKYEFEDYKANLGKAQSQLKEEADKLKAESKELSRQIKELTHEKKQLEEALTRKAKEKEEEVTKSMSALGKAQSQLKEEADKLKAESKELSRQIKELTHEKKQLEEALTRKAKEKEEEVTKSMSALGKAQSQLKEEADKLKAESKELSRQIKELTHEKKQLEEALTRKAKEKEEEVTKSMSALGKAQSQLKEEADKLKAESKELSRQIKELTHEKKQLEEALTRKAKEKEEEVTKQLIRSSKLQKELQQFQSLPISTTQIEYSQNYSATSAFNKIQYLKILFTILFFEAVTLSFSIHFFL